MLGHLGYGAFAIAGVLKSEKVHTRKHLTPARIFGIWLIDGLACVCANILVMSIVKN